MLIIAKCFDDILLQKAISPVVIFRNSLESIRPNHYADLRSSFTPDCHRRQRRHESHHSPHHHFVIPIVAIVLIVVVALIVVSLINCQRVSKMKMCWLDDDQADQWSVTTTTTMAMIMKIFR